MEIPDIDRMLEAGLHFGHQTRRWDPKMKEYIFGERNGIHIIDLQKSRRLLTEAVQAAERVAGEGKRVLFVGTKRQAKDVIKRQAERIGIPYVTERWLGGTLTNFQTIRHSMARLEELEGLEQDGPTRTVTKKEMLRLLKERGKLEKVLTGVRHMTALPGLVFVVDCKKERIAVAEANKLGIPVVAIVDTNIDPEKIDFPIPGNDDAMKSIKLITKVLAGAVEKGLVAHQERVGIEKKAKEEKAAEEAKAKSAAKKPVRHGKDSERPPIRRPRDIKERAPKEAKPAGKEAGGDVKEVKAPAKEAKGAVKDTAKAKPASKEAKGPAKDTQAPAKKAKSDAKGTIKAPKEQKDAAKGKPATPEEQKSPSAPQSIKPTKKEG